MKTTAFLTRILSWLTGCRLTVDNSVVRELDLDRFLGSWYEVARFDHFFERGMSQTKANYVLREDGDIDVINTGFKNGKPKTAKGKAKLTSTPALLRVSFFGPFYSDYRVMLVAADYRYILIGSGSDGYLWILSRTPQLPESDRTAILNEAKRRGYDTNKLIWVRQN
ncbi:MAG: lipocalin family protein [Bacteroidaceae bacterium]|nr:lipocalin family protein [Bacteroidaceae bacterium]